MAAQPMPGSGPSSCAAELTAVLSPDAVQIAVQIAKEHRPGLASCAGAVTRLSAGVRSSASEPSPMKKNYVLDTNVLLHDPHAIFRFEDNNVIIPIYVIEEVDQFKREGSERGRNARTIARLLDELRERAARWPRACRSRPAARLRVAVPEQAPDAAERHRSTRRWTRPSCRRRSTCASSDGGRPTIFVTMDTNLRIRADALGMVARDLREPARRGRPSSTSGIIEIEVDGSDDRRLLPRTGASRRASRRPLAEHVRAPARPRRTPRTRRSAATTRRKKRDHARCASPREGVMGVRPRNKEQSLRARPPARRDRSGSSPSSARRAPARRCSPWPRA